MKDKICNTCFFGFLMLMFFACIGVRHKKPYMKYLHNNKHVQNATCRDCHLTDSPKVKASSEQCLECHGSYEDVAELTMEAFPVNPHNSHYGNMKCTQCHVIHGRSVLYCNTCHFFPDVKVP